MAYFVYVLRNSEGRYYIGQTSNPERRLKRHNQGAVLWTKSRGPWEMVHREQFETRREAIAGERRLKRLKNRKSLERFIAHGTGSPKVLG